MMASRLNHREHVIPALTDHLEDKGGVVGQGIQAEVDAIFKNAYGYPLPGARPQLQQSSTVGANRGCCARAARPRS